MKIAYFVFFICIVVNSNLVAQLKVSLTFWDIKSGVDLKTTVYGINEEGKFLLANSSNNKTVIFDLPTSVDFILLESDGFETITLKVNFIGDFLLEGKANVSINTLGFWGNSDVRDCLIFSCPNKIKSNAHYEVKRLIGKDEYIVADISSLLRFTQSFTKLLRNDDYESTYILNVIDSDKSVLLKKNIIHSHGLNFIDLNHDDNSFGNVEKVAKENTFLASGNCVVFFQKSKYYLLPEAQKKLMELVSYLKKKPKVKIKVSGHTDKVGDHRRNVVLSKYRAKTVANFLVRNGIETERILIEWEDGKYDEKMIDSNTDLGSLRKVTITEFKN